MITISPTDYVILAAIFAVVTLKILSDILDIKASRAAKRGLRLIAKKNFLPRLTIIIPLESLDNAKQMLQDLEGVNFPVSTTFVAHSGKGAKEARALRYFIKKRAIKRAKVVTRKQPNHLLVAKEQAKSGLVVAVPDSAKLTKSFYQDAILPFGDNGLDALVLASNVRPNTTIASGIEVLFSAWRRYLSLGSSSAAEDLSNNYLPEGVVIRAKYIRKMPMQRLQIVQTRKSSYSVSAQKNISLAWLKLQETVRLIDVLTICIMTICGIFILQVTANSALIFGVFAFLYSLVVWWSLDMIRTSFADRISVLLLSPLLYAVAWSLVVARSIRLVRGL